MGPLFNLGMPCFHCVYTMYRVPKKGPKSCDWNPRHLLLKRMLVFIRPILGQHGIVACASLSALDLVLSGSEGIAPLYKRWLNFQVQGGAIISEFERLFVGSTHRSHRQVTWLPKYQAF